MDDSPLHRFPNFPGGTWDSPPDSRASACILQLRLNDVCRMVWLAGQFTSSYVSTSKSLQRESVPICCAPTNLEGVQSQGYMGVLHFTCERSRNMLPTSLHCIFFRGRWSMMILTIRHAPELSTHSRRRTCRTKDGKSRPFWRWLYPPPPGVTMLLLQLRDPRTFLFNPLSWTRKIQTSSARAQVCLRSEFPGDGNPDPSQTSPRNHCRIPSVTLNHHRCQDPRRKRIALMDAHPAKICRSVLFRRQ